MTDNNEFKEDFRFGYVSIIGRPNVGKSTLLNQILGQKVSIVTAKPQTTRQKLAGIKTTPQGQVVYVDTPGIHHSAKRALNRYMNRVAQASFRDVDLVLFLVEAGNWSRQDEFVAKALRSVDVPVMLVLNKIDLVPDKESLLTFIDKNFSDDDFVNIMMISAKNGSGVDELEKQVLSRLPFSRPFYDSDQFTDRSERFLASEMIREQLTLRLHQELPYALTVQIEEFKRAGNLLTIGAIIYVERDSQKQITIGKKGVVLKQVGSGARLVLEELFGEKIFLRLWVKVSKDWSDSDKLIERYGYTD
ncbi:MAG: GTPase Era [Xanthomonadales bacterium]|nr:GTPase Era [Xanthomonadales bacterium]